MPYVNMQRGPRTRLATARAIPWCRLLRFHVQMNGGWVKVANDMWAPLWMTIPPGITELSGAIEMWLQE